MKGGLSIGDKSQSLSGILPTSQNTTNTNGIPIQSGGSGILLTNGQTYSYIINAIGRAMSKVITKLLGVLYHINKYKE